MKVKKYMCNVNTTSYIHFPASSVNYTNRKPVAQHDNRGNNYWKNISPQGGNIAISFGNNMSKKGTEKVGKRQRKTEKKRRESGK